jgi:poly(3-hydroxybutyrate) depolymerase
MAHGKWSLFLLIFLFCACKKEEAPLDTNETAPRVITKTIQYHQVSVDVVIDQPAGDSLDVILVFHGTVDRDALILDAAKNTLSEFKKLLDRQDMMLISVAYPEEGLLFGDNIAHCEAALLWTRHLASAELGVTVKKIFLAGHSQGGYLATRLNTMHPTQGAIANAPGPLNLLYRCQLEESGSAPQSQACTRLRNQYGTTTASPEAYIARSLLHFTAGYTSDVLFVQGLADSPIQMHSWPAFRQRVEECTDCRDIAFLEIPGMGHGALFNSQDARAAFNAFIDKR